MTALSGGHLAVDLAYGRVPAHKPVLTERLGLNNPFAALLLRA
jgi:hypothetical protein